MIQRSYRVCSTMAQPFTTMTPANSTVTTSVAATIQRWTRRGARSNTRLKREWTSRREHTAAPTKVSQMSARRAASSAQPMETKNT